MTDIYTQMIETLHNRLSMHDLPSDQAAAASVDAVAALCETFGGQRVYLPRRTPWINPQARDKAIVSRFDGRNIDSICLQFGVSRRTVYRAIKR